MKVVFLNMSSQFEWDEGVYNRNKHILDEFAKRDDIEQILSVDFLPYNLKSLLRLIIKGKLYKKEDAFMFGLGYKVTKLNEKIISVTTISLNFLKKIVKKLDFKDAIVLNYSPFNIKQFSIFKNNRQYFDAVDNWSENKTFRKQKELLKKNYRIIIKNSKAVFTRPEKMKDIFLRLAYSEKYTESAYICSDIKDNIFIVKNGVDVSHYKTPKVSEKVDNIFNNIDPKYKVKIGYVGVLKEDRIDVEMLEYLVKNNQDKMFVIAGPIMDGFDSKRFNKYENIIFPGKMSYNEMSAIFSKFDICIIPHLLNEFIKSMDPIKLYEYLAAGKSIITVNVPGADGFSDLIKISNTKEGFDTFIKEISNNLEEYSSEEKKKEKQEAVEKLSWENKANETIEIIKNNF